MKLKIAAAILAGTAGLFLMTSCSKQIEGNEKTHPTYIKAKADKDAGRYKDAADGLNDLLQRAPRSALLHKELALLYSDNIADYYRAIYHFQRFLELSKPGQDDRHTINGYILSCKKRAAIAMVQEDPTVAGAAAPQEDPMQAQRMALLEARERSIRQQYEINLKELESLKGEVEKLRGGKGAAKPAASAATAAAPAAATAAGGDTYVVVPGDTLTKIARKVYGGAGTPANVERIRQANGLSGNAVKVGQKLVIPKLPK